MYQLLPPQATIDIQHPSHIDVTILPVFPGTDQQLTTNMTLKTYGDIAVKQQDNERSNRHEDNTN